MTVPVGIERNDYPGTGAQTVFAYTFQIFAEDELHVIETVDATGVTTELALTTDYTVQNVNVLAGGTITRTVATAAGTTISIISDVEYKQSTQLRNQGRYFPATVERAFDRVVRMIKQLVEILNRSIQVPEAELRTSAMILPAKVTRAGKFLACDGNGDIVASAGTPPANIVVSGFAETFLDDTTGPNVCTTIGAISKTIVDAKGDLIGASADDTPVRVPGASTDGKILASQASQSHGLIWTDYTRPNLLINPNWLVDQIFEGGAKTAAGGSGNTQTVDGWSANAIGAGDIAIQQVTDPDNAALKALKISCQTADAAIAAGDAYYVFTAIEGYDCADLMIGTASAASVTLRFKAKFNVTGVYGISIANSATNRSYVGIMTVPNTNENEYTLTLTLDAAGAWLYTNGVGLYLRICLAAGANFQKAAGAWGADNMLTTNAQVNFMSVNTNVGYIKRIQLIPGTVALAYGPQDIQKELAKCQRYYWKSFAQGTAPAQAIAAAALANAAIRAAAVSHTWQTIPFPVTMRTNPTGITYNSVSANSQVRDITSATDCSGTAISLSQNGFIISCTGNAATGIDSVLNVHATANARLS